MKILICGLPGTGKTTLSHIIAEKYGFVVKNDFSIFNELSINIKNQENKKKVSKDYSKLLFDHMQKTQGNVVYDFEYSILPSDLIHFDLDKFKIVFLGFYSLPEEIIFNLFRKSSANEKVADDELKHKIMLYKSLSKACREECEKYGFKFFDINKDRNIIFDEILKYFELSWRRKSCLT